MKKWLSLFLLLLGFSLSGVAQVNFSVSYKRVNPTEIDVIFKGKISSGWHVYSTDLPPGGPTAATFHVDKKSGVEAMGKLKAGPGARTVHDEIFDMNVTYYTNSCQFTQRLKITQKNYSLKGYLEFGACDNANCLPPTPVDCKVSGSDGPDVSNAKNDKKEDAKTTQEKEAAASLPANAQTDSQNIASDAVSADSAGTNSAKALLKNSQTDSATVAKWYAPVISKMKMFGEANSPVNKSLLYIFLMGFLGGFIALFTPCVWPIIPMTVSFFLHRSSEKKKGIRDAVTYGLSIVVIYVALGLIITSIFGANALNNLSTNAIFNILFFLLLILFGASFLGGFELTLPSSWSNKIDAKAGNTTGLISIFLMAFTLALVSFSCTGPIIGFLLVAVSTAGSSYLAPTIGMLGFAIALSLPFTLFALFPTWLKKAPKSGGWLNVVKVVLGFVELAFSLKFLSVADLAYGWHILDRETFLALWIALYGLLACYLFGWIKFPHDDESRKTSVPRFFIGICSLAFAIYMIPGLWGAPCKAISAFSPPIATQDFNLDPVKIEPKFQDYDAGMAYAKEVGKPVLLDFTGHGCVNCRKMELAVWHDPKVKDLLTKDYVLISLYVDEKTPLPEPVEVKIDGKERTLRTIGDKWSYLQQTKFGANAQPFYVPVDNEGNPLNHSASYDVNIKKYIKFLEEGLKHYREKQGK